MKYFNEAKENFLLIENSFSKYATTSEDCIRIRDIVDDIRTPFFRDVDRIIYAFSYSRYSDKTQVYSYKENDHISRRMIHVQFVSKIARTIGRALGLNTDLIEAIALGHDIGHTPLGHTGEALLNEISIRELKETFAHNIQGVRHYMEVENNGEGLNLSIQVLDGIMCHNGEILSNEYIPEVKTKEVFLEQYYNAYKDYKGSLRNRPMTLEGCVVRISDVIAYIGRDIEDAIELGFLKQEDIPSNITNVLGSRNSDIINTIVTDIIDNSINKESITMSQEVYNAIVALKDFNYKNIYNKSITDGQREYYRSGMNKIYNEYLEALENGDSTNIIYKIFLNKQTEGYRKRNSNKRIVIDFIAGMTDDLFLKEIEKYN